MPVPPKPPDEQRIFSELAQLHDAYARIEARLKELFECQKGIDVSMAELSRHCVAWGPPGGEAQTLVECNPTVGRLMSHGSDGPKRSRIALLEQDLPMNDHEKGDEQYFGLEPESDNSNTFVASTLPLGWPQVLNVRAEMLGMANDSRMAGSSSMNLSAVGRSSRELSEEIVLASHRCVIDPNSRFHLIWSTSSILVLIWDLIVLPYVLVWDVKLTGVLHLTWYLTPAFWTVDLVLNFFTAFYSGVDLQKSLKQIWRAYLRTWFVPDLCVVSLDWVSVIISEMSNSADSDSRSLKMLRFIKLGRLLRILDMMRVLRLFRIMEEISMMYLTEGSRLGLQMLNLLLGIMWVVHILACVWFGIGKEGPTDTGARWTDAFDVLVDGHLVPVIEAGELYQYWMSFHWAAGQIALGGIDVMPVNSFERFFFASMMMCGFLFGSCLVSLLSAAMIDYRMMQKDKTTRLSMLRQYLRENGVNANLYLPVMKQVEQRVGKRESLDEKDVTALQLLSSTLRSQLRYEIQKPHLSRHAVFRLWESLDAMSVRRMCMGAVKFITIRAKDDLFVPGSVANAAYTLVSGSMAYIQHPDSSPVETEGSEAVHVGQWICEAALWVLWTHVGQCEAATSCKLLEIDAAELVHGLQSNMVMRDIGFEYCLQFHKRVTAACPPHSPYPTDLCAPFTDYCDLVVSMSPQAQVVIGRDALGHLSTSGNGRSAKAILNLQREVDISKSIVLVEGTGAIIRVVSLIVLRLMNERGEVLAQVGKWSGSDMQGICQFPGLKQERDELVGETINRFLKNKTPELDGRLEYTGITRETNEKESKEYGVQTRYLRSICSARLLDGQALDTPKCAVLQAGRISERINKVDIEKQEDSEHLEATQAQALDKLYKVDVHVLRDASGNPNLYAWLPPEQVSTLGMSSWDRVLQKWVSRLAFESSANDSDSDEDSSDGFAHGQPLQGLRGAIGRFDAGRS